MHERRHQVFKWKKYTFHDDENTAITNRKWKKRLRLFTLCSSIGPATSHLGITLHAITLKTAVLNFEICDSIVLVLCSFISRKNGSGFPSSAAELNQQQALSKWRFMRILAEQKSSVWRSAAETSHLMFTLHASTFKKALLNLEICNSTVLVLSLFIIV